MTPRLITLWTFIIGFGIFSYSLTLPYYNNQKLADKLIDNYYNNEPSENHNITKSDYYKKEAELCTNKVMLIDLGAGLSIASATILIFLILAKIKRFEDFKRLKTSTKTTAFIAANLGWLALIPATYWYYFYRLGRGDYPPFADSIGIPIMAQQELILFSLIPINIFFYSLQL